MKTEKNASQSRGKALFQCVTLCLNRALGSDKKEKDAIVRWMRKYERFCGVRIIGYRMMHNHIHLQVALPESSKPNGTAGEEVQTRLSLFSRTWGLLSPAIA